MARFGGGWLAAWILFCACSDERPSPRPPDAAVRDDAGAEDGGSETTPDAGPDGSDEEQDAGAPVDACGNVPVEGRCRDAETLETCVVPTGAAPRELVVTPCEMGTTCEATEAGAACVQVAECLAGEARCDDATTLAICQDGQFVTGTCPQRCLASALGAACAADVSTRTLGGEAHYVARIPNEAFSDWSTETVAAQARGFLLLSMRGDELIDVVSTSLDDATFSVQVANETGVDDALVLIAAAAGPTGELAYAVADAGYEPSNTPRALFNPHPDDRLWSWRFPVQASLEVTEAMGSGAAHVFTILRAITHMTDGFYAPAQSKSLIAWLGIGTSWECGACMARSPLRVFDLSFDRQLWFDGSSAQGYWSSAVTTHEAGHYVMSAYGFELSEGGPHFLGYRTNPGQAYSEGFSTFFSSVIRGDTRYFDKQEDGQGGQVFFWWDIDQRTYNNGNPVWERANAAEGLEQLIDENEVAANLHDTFVALDSDLAPILQALASEHMTQAPFPRGYTARSWSNPEHPENYRDTGEPHPYLADLYDALRCAGAIDAPSLDGVNDPNVHYPYRAEAELCE